MTPTQPQIPETWKPFTSKEPDPSRPVESHAIAVPKSLVSKLAEVMSAVERVAKRGHNDHFHYDFATESDITAAIRKELATRSLMLVPHVESVSWREVPTRAGVNHIACAMVEFTVYDGESDAQLKFRVPGEGQDGGDKCIPKALTSAVKYALLKLFLIPTGDDPERTEADKPARRQRSTPPDPPPAGVNPETGEELDSPMPSSGHRLTAYHFNTPWHQCQVLAYDAQGGALTISTKLSRVGAAMKRACESGEPVVVDVTMKPGGRGEAYVNKIEDAAF